MAGAIRVVDGVVVADSTATVAAQSEDTIRQAARDALATNRTFVALAAPTNAQLVAQAKALSRQMNGIIRLLLGQLDSTD